MLNLFYLYCEYLGMMLDGILALILNVLRSTLLLTLFHLYIEYQLVVFLYSTLDIHLEVQLACYHSHCLSFNLLTHLDCVLASYLKIPLAPVLGNWLYFHLDHWLDLLCSLSKALCLNHHYGFHFYLSLVCILKFLLVPLFLYFEYQLSWSLANFF